nr:helix-turn-helix transcriptional regulator [Agreia sp. PsM10]
MVPQRDRSSRVRIRHIEDFGAIARQRRQDLGLSQAEIATRAGVTRQWLVRFERGNSEVSLSKVFSVLTELALLVTAEPVESSDSSVAVTKHTFSVPKIEMPLLDMTALRASLEAASRLPSQAMVAGVRDAIQRMNAPQSQSRTTEADDD